MNLPVGEAEGNRSYQYLECPERCADRSAVSALMVALDMIHIHKHTKSWALEVVLVTDGESAFRQDEYEDAMKRFDEMGVKLTVV